MRICWPPRSSTSSRGARCGRCGDMRPRRCCRPTIAAERRARRRRWGCSLARRASSSSSVRRASTRRTCVRSPRPRRPRAASARPAAAYSRSRTRGAAARGAGVEQHPALTRREWGAAARSRCRDGRLPGLAHLTLLPRDSGGGGGGALASQCSPWSGRAIIACGSPHSRSPLAPLRSSARSPPPPQQQRQQVGTGMPLPPLVTSGSDPAAPAAQLRSDPASLGGATTAAAAAAAAAAGSALDDAAALPAAASLGAKISSRDRARERSARRCLRQTRRRCARWLRRRMEMERPRRRRAWRGGCGGGGGHRSLPRGDRGRHAARRGAARRAKLPLPWRRRIAPVLRLGFSRVARGTRTARAKTPAAVWRHGAEVRCHGADAVWLGIGAQAAAAPADLEDTGWAFKAQPRRGGAT